jgi:hypothetical protein
MKKCNLEVCQEFAENKDGKLISTEYINSYTKMSWECEKGHQWKARWGNIKGSQQWCPHCNREASKVTIIELQEFAKNKEGKLISDKYTSNKTKMLWECKEGHQWEASWNSVSSGNWCWYCFGKIKYSIQELKKYAIDRNGKLISTEYINNNTKMLWECKEGHQWEAIWKDIKSKGCWCPECVSFKTEKICKELLEQKLGIKFIKTNFIYTNSRYQWDGYNKENKIAFEYHGYQHYIFPNFFQKTKEAHEKAKQRDIDKVIYAKENNIKLIIIPYTEEKNLENYIINQIKLLNIRT